MTASEATPGAQPARAAGRGEDGMATLVFPLVMWIAVVAAIAIVDVTAYLVAGARAQQLADAAALAAVAVDADPADGVARWVPAAGGDARLAAQRIAAAGDGRLEACTCVSGREQAAVRVSVPVPGLVIPHLGAQRVTAGAEAVLTDYWPPAGPAAPDRRGRSALDPVGRPTTVRRRERGEGRRRMDRPRNLGGPSIVEPDTGVP